MLMMNEEPALKKVATLEGVLENEIDVVFQDLGQLALKSYERDVGRTKPSNVGLKINHTNM
ncbi:unnamed protein product [Lupinus luteus]|uniref:Uncharacterized protein n=1 Tax=Lupinus luteus TaxID=3873 RepID=A0AAV1VVW1_LUPLU